ncbi:hypothetical protein GGR50DRAFT_678727 [Xylaria sp. CBS 124048]|nr:hypothetical protein GGR50DRAFT_678727 [Xylaria sp. CBS 124048]
MAPRPESTAGESVSEESVSEESVSLEEDGIELPPSYWEATEDPPHTPPPAFSSICPAKRPRRHHWSDFLDRKIPGLALPVAVLVSCIVTAGLTAGLAVGVTSLVRNAKVAQDPETWRNKIRSEYYDPCYYGCGDCGDPSYSYRACLKTASIQSGDPNITCDAREMWYWADRYPFACLNSLVEPMRNKALADLKETHKHLYALVILVVLAGAISGLLVYHYWRKRTAKMRERARARIQATSWPGQRHSHNRGTHRPNRIKRAILVILPLFSRKASAEPCTNIDPTADRYLTNNNETIFVRVHGWFSDCNYSSNCQGQESCNGLSCPVNTIIHCGMKRLLGEPCVVSDTLVCASSTSTPDDFVNDMVPAMAACDFHLTRKFFPNPKLRLPNPGFEKNWFVKVSVNGFNVTDPGKVDPEIMCLHSIGDRMPSRQRMTF